MSSPEQSEFNILFDAEEIVESYIGKKVRNSIAQCHNINSGEVVYDSEIVEEVATEANKRMSQFIAGNEELMEQYELEVVDGKIVHKLTGAEI